jgi:hypothetical protein
MYLYKKLSPFETLRASRVLSASGGLPNLPRYETLAVADYGCTSHALHLRQTRQSLNLGKAIFSNNFLAQILLLILAKIVQPFQAVTKSGSFN